MISFMIRVVVVALLGLLISACSRTQLAYRNADWLLEYYAGQAVDISAVQREQWQPVLSGILQKHQDSELAYLVDYLDMAGAAVAKDHDAVDAACLVDAALFVYRRHARLAVDLAVPLLADLDQDQVAHLSDYTAERQASLVERYLDPDPERRNDARRKRFQERVEKWIGRLNPDQQRLLDTAIKRIPDVTPYWLAYRARQSAGLLQMLEGGADTERLHQYLDSWWVRWDGRSPEYVRSWAAAKQAFVLFLDRLGTSLTPQQRETLTRRVDALRMDLAELLPPVSATLPLSAVVSGCEAAPV